MASKASDPERVDLALGSIATMLDDLVDVRADWERLSADERLNWSLDWGNEMVKLRQLAEAVVAGRLDARRTGRVHKLAERVVAQFDTLERLELRLPTGAVLTLGRAPV
jgi:hypothetical protein